MRRNEVSREAAGLGHRSVAKDAAPVERAGEKVSNRSLNVEPPGATQEVVVSEASFELDEIDGIEAGAQASLAWRRLLHGDDDHLRGVRCCDVDGRTRLYSRSPKQIRFIE